MNLAVFHYHVNRGGVTRVVENQLLALDLALSESPSPNVPWRVAILHGGRREGFSTDLPDRLKHLEVSLCEVPELEYDELQSGPQPAGPAELLIALMQALGELAFTPGDTVLHVHNHSLGKNRALTEVLPVLAGDGYPLLLQLHDFAEDFRPKNYAKVAAVAAEGMLYPQAAHIHYAVLNARDHDALTDCGVAADRLHLLPNPVAPLDNLPPRDAARAKLAEQFDVRPDARVLLYPVRCIRRKNIGEALLLGLLAPTDSVVALTLPPLNPIEKPAYEQWRRLAEELRLPCRFEVGAPEGLTFRQNLAAADAIITTSLAEGFGMVFLEAWLAGRPLLGRDLPEISRDFRAAGVDYPWLYPRLDVPLAWIGEQALLDHLRAAYRATAEAYRLDEPTDLDLALRAKIVDAGVDFGDLDVELQQQMVRHVATHDDARNELLARNVGLAETLALESTAAHSVIERNAQVIRGQYAHAPSGRRLLSLYEHVAASSRDTAPGPLADRDALLGRYLSPGRFRPLRR